MVSKPPSRGFAESWLVESKTDVTKKYIVSKRPSGTFACDCPAWKFARAPKPDCKHIEGVKDILRRGGSYETAGAVVDEVALVRSDEPSFTARQQTVVVSFDGVVVAHLTPAQAENFKASMRAIGATSPEFNAPKPVTSTFGDFTIRRKMRLGEKL